MADTTRPPASDNANPTPDHPGGKNANGTAPPNPRHFRPIPETEIPPSDTASLSLSQLSPSNQPTPLLNPSARGWSRRPLSDTRLHSGLGTWGRNKRWEYYGVTTPRHVVGVTVSSLDYAGVAQLFVLDRRTRRAWSREVVDPLARRVRLPETYARGGGDAAGSNACVKSGGVEIEIFDEEERGGSGPERERVTRIVAKGGGGGGRGDEGEVRVDVELRRGVEDDALHVVVPWSERLFQYTIKEPAIPARGTITVDGETHVFGGDADSKSFGVLDHGRGRWPYSTTWNWAAGSGIVNGQRVGLQLGGKWTEGTGSTENAVIIGGRLIKISEELEWEYDRSDWLKPWRVTGQDLDATFTPFYERAAKTSLIVIESEMHQCFGTWSGTFKLPDGTILSLDGLEGWAEEARNKW
ncbi:hypothetical protein VTK26DRAFT_3060 [Humicola hyalothermophila]